MNDDEWDALPNGGRLTVIDTLPLVKNAVAAMPSASDHDVVVRVMKDVGGKANPTTVSCQVVQVRGRGDGSIVTRMRSLGSGNSFTPIVDDDGVVVWVAKD